MKFVFSFGFIFVSELIYVSCFKTCALCNGCATPTQPLQTQKLFDLF